MEDGVSDGLIVSDIEFNPAVNKIYISTFGRGIWYSDLSSFTGVNTSYATPSQYELYPSLNQGNFSISSSSQQTANLEIYDIKGRQVYEGRWNGKSQEYQLDLPNGLYFARMKTDKNLDVKKFIIQNN